MNKRGLLIGIVFLSAMIYAQVPEPDGADNTPTVTIDGLLYKLDLGTHTAMVANTNNWEGELYIPEQVAYEGETYTVNSLEWLAFDFCKTLTKVWIPKTVVDIRHYIQWDDCKNPFRGCTSLESIEVDESNPSMCSVDGVLFNKDMTRLFCYPAGARSETYIVPDGVTWLGGDAFAYNSSLTSIYMPNSVAHMAFSTFCNCKSLNSIRLSENIKYIEAYTFDSCDNLRFLDIPESVMGFGESVFRNSPLDTLIIRGTFPDGLRNDTFYFVDKERTVIYCQPSEIDKFKMVFKGTVLPLSDYIQDDYLPFVEMGKLWNVVIPYGEPYYGGSISGFQMIEEVERDGKAYAHTQRNLYAECEVQEAGLFREENRRVYKYNETTGRDIMMYDFSLKEGDTFTYEFGYDQPVNCKVLKEGWLEDGPDIISSSTSNPDGTLDIKYRKLRTWTIGRENESGEYEEIATWVECIGALENVFGLIDNGLIKFENSLAYVRRKGVEVGDGKNDYLPFSFYSISMHGCNLPTGESNEEYDDELHHLTYEMEGDRLHIYGDVYTQCGPNNYAYFYEMPPEYYNMPTDDPSVRIIELLLWEVAPVADCMAHHHTDFYVTGFDPNLNYYVSDNKGEIHPVIKKMAYHPFIEDDKVWIVRLSSEDEPEQEWFQYYYFDGDTIVNGQTAKRMLVDIIGSIWDTSGEYVGAWYEQDKKVYYAAKGKQEFELLYDFTLSTGDNIQSTGRVWQVTKMSGGIPGFKGTYYGLQNEYQTSIVEHWLEGVGSMYYPWLNLLEGWSGASFALLVCKAGDEIIYYNSEEEDPFSMGAKKHRFDFSHTIKTKPKARTREDNVETLYGEYNNQLLDIRLNPLDDTYLVRITNESDQVVYEETINAGSIVGLNIDISAFAKGRYTVTMENSSESFTGEFETLTTGIQELKSSRIEELKSIYNLQGQRLNRLQKGLNIVNGRKVFVK